MYQRCLSGARTADDAHGLPLFHGKINIAERLRTGILIGKIHMPELNISALLRFPVPRFLLRQRTFQFQHAGNPVRTGKCLCHRNDQIRQLHQFHKDLGHIVDQRDHLTLSQDPVIHPHRAGPDQHHRGAVYDNISHRVHTGGKTPHKHLHFRQHLVLPGKSLQFLILPVEGADHPDAGQIFPCPAQHLIQPRLHLLIERNADQHDPEHHNGEQRDRHHKDKCRLHIDGKRHDHRPEHDKGRAQKQTQHQIHPGLHLVDIACHPRDHRRRSQLIHLRIGQGLDMGKQRMPQIRGKARCRLRREILRRHGTDQPDHGKQHQYASHLPDVPVIRPADPGIHDLRDHQRHKQLKGGLQQFKQRSQHRFLFIIL